MLETVIAVSVLTAAFLAVFHFSQMLHARILLDHAAARAARARAVGLNEFMCRKVARAAAIPVSGRCVWPGSDGLGSETARVPLYLQAPDEARARGVLEYDRWSGMKVRVSSGLASVADAEVEMDAGDFRMSGRGSVESHYPFYMDISRH